MRNSFLALATFIMLFLLSLQPSWAENDYPNQEFDNNQTNLPTMLDDDFFDALPFEQRRQALREEVELNPQRTPRPKNTKNYNLLIRWALTPTALNACMN